MKRNNSKMYKKLKFGNNVNVNYYRLKNKIYAGLFKKKIKRTVDAPYEIAKKDFIVYLKFFKKGIERGDKAEGLKQLNEELIKSNFLEYGLDNKNFKEFLKNLSLPITDEKKAEILKIIVDKLAEITE